MIMLGRPCGCLLGDNVGIQPTGGLSENEVSVIIYNDEDYPYN